MPRVSRWFPLAFALHATACADESSVPRGNLEQLPVTYAPRGSNDAVVARVDGAPIYQSDVARQARATGAGATDALNDLMTLEVLAQRAATRAWSGDRTAKESVRQLLAQAYVQKEIEPKLRLEDVPESILKQAYERTQKAHMHERLVRVALLQLHTPAKAGSERRRLAALWAKELATWAGRPTNREIGQWRALPQTPPWSDRQLSFGVAWVERGEAYSEALNYAIHSLAEPGQATALVEDQMGFHVGLYLGERAAQNVSFEQAAPRLRQAIHEAWRQRRFIELTDELAHEAGLQLARTATPGQ